MKRSAVFLFFALSVSVQVSVADGIDAGAVVGGGVGGGIGGGIGYQTELDGSGVIDELKIYNRHDYYCSYRCCGRSGWRFWW